MTNKKSFFVNKEKKDAKGKGSQKRKRSDKPSSDKVKVKKVKFSDEEITSESENEEVVQEVESDHETANEKRNRLAKKMLEEIKDKLSQEDEDVNSYLKSQVLDASGRVFHSVADEYECPTEEEVQYCKWSNLGTVTCAVVSSDGQFIFSGCKSGHIVKWSLSDCKKLSAIKGIRKKDVEGVGHSEVTCLALSKDNKFLASGGFEKVIHVWDPTDMKHLHTFQGHRSHIASLCFQVGSHTLYSASHDKSVKLWNLDEMAYVETLFGHEDAVMSIDCLSGERAVTCGGRDNTVRFWKIPEESHLVFAGRLGNIDCVKFIDNTHFLSSSCDNSLALWSTDRKKPAAVVAEAHESSNQWISALATLRHHDIAVSGCYDGYLRFWKISKDFKSLERLFSVKLEGYINGIQFSDDGMHCVVAIGREHRLGRWFEPMKAVKNSIAVIKLKKMKTTVANGKL